MTSQQIMLELEKQHLNSHVRSSNEQLGALLCDDFREFGASGKIFDKTDALTYIASNCGNTKYEIDEYQISLLGELHVLATYKLSEQYGEFVRMTLRSTVWKQEGAEWRILFHQGTEQAEQ